MPWPSYVRNFAPAKLRTLRDSVRRGTPYRETPYGETPQVSLPSTWSPSAGIVWCCSAASTPLSRPVPLTSPFRRMRRRFRSRAANAAALRRMPLTPRQPVSHPQASPQWLQCFPTPFPLHRPPVPRPSPSSGFLLPHCIDPLSRPTQAGRTTWSLLAALETSRQGGGLRGERPAAPALSAASVLDPSPLAVVPGTSSRTPLASEPSLASLTEQVTETGKDFQARVISDMCLSSETEREHSGLECVECAPLIGCNSGTTWRGNCPQNQGKGTPPASGYADCCLDGLSFSGPQALGHTDCHSGWCVLEFPRHDRNTATAA